MQYNTETTTSLPGTPKSAGKEPTANLAEFPKIPPLEKPLVAKKHKMMIHKFHVKIAFIVPVDKEVCPCEKFAALLALIIQQFL
eukprot:11372712-Ditylum_brightwellii.AAC.1